MPEPKVSRKRRGRKGQVIGGIGFKETVKERKAMKARVSLIKGPYMPAIFEKQSQVRTGGRGSAASNANLEGASASGGLGWRLSTLGSESAKVGRSKLPPMVAAARWAAGNAWSVALANHDVFPVGESCEFGGRGFGRAVLALPKRYRTPSRIWLEAAHARTLPIRKVQEELLSIEEINLLQAKNRWRHAQDLVGRDVRTGGPIEGTSGDMVGHIHQLSRPTPAWGACKWSDLMRRMLAKHKGQHRVEITDSTSETPQMKQIIFSKAEDPEDPNSRRVANPIIGLEMRDRADVPTHTLMSEVRAPIASWDAARLSSYHPHALPRKSPAEIAHQVRSATYQLAAAGFDWRRFKAHSSQQLSKQELMRRVSAAYKHGWAVEVLPAREAMSALRFAKKLMSRARPLTMQCGSKGIGVAANVGPFRGRDPLANGHVTGGE